MKKLVALGIAIGAMMTSPAVASVVTLDFEDIGDLVAIGNYYDGGTGVNHGIGFSEDAITQVSLSAGGAGQFTNQPSGSTIMFFLDPDLSYVNYASGFTGQFSFAYSSLTDAFVTLYSGENKTGAVLGSVNIAAQHNDNCAGDFCNWTLAGTSFSGTAKSVAFGSAALQTAFDDMRFGSDAQVGGAVPEPATWAMMIGGFGAIGGTMRNRRRSVSARFA